MQCSRRLRVIRHEAPDVRRGDRSVPEQLLQKERHALVARRNHMVRQGVLVKQDFIKQSVLTYLHYIEETQWKSKLKNKMN